LPIAAVLIALLGVSLLEPVYAVAGRGAAEALYEQAGQRRGKNGPARKSTGGDAPARSEQDEGRDDSAGPPPDTGPASQTAGGSPLGGQSNESRRSSPPPFNRPPLGSASPPAGGRQDRATQPPRRDQSGGGQGQRQSRTPAPDETLSGQPPAGDANDRRPQDRTRSQPPVLRRPSESRNVPDEQAPPPIGGARSGGADETGAAPPPTGADDDEPIKLEGTLVNIPLLVSDRSGRYVPQLGQRDFMLYEDGVQQEIAFFGNQEVPFNVVLLMDMSPSVQGNAEDIQDAAIEFVRQLRPQDRVMVASFDRSVDFLTDFTSNRRELESAIRSTATGSGTSVYDAVYRAVTQKLRNVEGRKALLLLSDGEDTTSSQASYDEAIDIVTESDVLVYGLRYPGGNGSIRVDPWPNTRNPIPRLPFPFPFPWPGRRRRGGTFIDSSFQTRMNATASVSASSAQYRQRRGRGGDFMADITTAGGGPVYDAERISDLRGLATRIAEELRHVYMISYYPTNALSNGGYRSIRVRVSNRDDIAVRHRRGYQASDITNRPRTE
jgi:Ca-activated chloride channel family protein